MTTQYGRRIAEVSAPPVGQQDISGLILAGGQAQRMQAGWKADSPGHRLRMPDECSRDWQGIDKGLLSVAGKLLIEHACDFMRPQVSRLLISANRYLDVYARYGEVITDACGKSAEPQGPLAGISAVLPHVGTPWLAVLPVDVLAPPSDLFPRLFAALAEHEHAPAAFASVCGASGSRDHPLCLALHTSLQDDLYRRLQRGERKVLMWLEDIGALRVSFIAGQHTFENLNTPEALRSADARAGRPQEGGGG
jgi:molybdopterin-guanine dinucleotide biosynthesis protein A